MTLLHPDNPAILMLDSQPNTVVRFSSVGSYPVFYVTDDAGALCATCVQDEIEQCIDPENSGFHVATHDVNWENPSLYCDHCSQRIESAYAEDDVEKPKPSGYTPCPCRDCFEISIDGALCNDCEEHDCAVDGDSECDSPHAYGGSEETA